MLVSATKARRESVKVPQAAFRVVTNQQQNGDEPLLMEITPEIASNLIVIYEYMPKSEVEPTLEEIVTMAVSYFRSRLEHGETQILSDEEAEIAINARKQSQEGP